MAAQTVVKQPTSNLWQKANEVGVSVRDILDQILAGQITLAHTSQIASAYKRILEEIASLREAIHNNPSEIVNIIAPEGVEPLETLRDALEDAIGTAGEYTDELSLDVWLGKVYKEMRDQISMPEVPDTVDHVRVMILHASKGLSAKLVIIASCIEGFIPREISEASDDVKQRALEEARRLFYVAITRCKNHPGDYPGTLILSSFVRVSGLDAVQMGLPARVDQMRTCRASRFIQELGPSCPTPILGERYLSSL